MKNKTLAALAALIFATGLAVAQDDVNSKVQSGWQALQQGKLKDARELFQSVLDAAPNYDFGWYALGQVATREGKFQEAIGHFRKATEINADKFEYHYGMAAAYRTVEEYAKAIATLNNAESLASGSKENAYYLHLERGLSYSSIGQFERAVPDLIEAVKLQPAQKMPNQRLGISYYGLEDYGEALTYLKKAASIDAKDYTTQLYLARSLVNVAQAEPDKAKKVAFYKDGERAAQAAHQVKPGVDALTTLGKAQLGAGNYDGAVRAFQGVVKDKPKYCAAHVNLGQAFLGLKDWPRASAALEQATACDGKNTITLNLLGFSYLKQQDRDRSLAAYEKSYGLKADPAVATNITKVKENIRIAAENSDIENFNTQQLQSQEAEQADFERKQREFEEEQKKIKAYKEKDN